MLSHRETTLRIRAEQRGFTLIELLVVVLIIGILAAIAIPAFLGQRQKAQDSSAKSATRQAASAAESIAVDTRGKYDGTGAQAITVANLKTTEPSLNDSSQLTVAALSADSFTVGAKSASGTFFNMTRTNGATVRCTSSAAPAAACSGASTW